MRHISMHHNPAHIASQGFQLKDLLHSELWWSGPVFWPVEEDLFKHKELPELKARALLVKPPEDFVEQFSSYNKMLRVAAWCHRFVQNAQNQKLKKELDPTLQLWELELAEHHL